MAVQIVPILAMLASAAMQSYSQNRALKKRQQEAVQAQQRQSAARQQATDSALKRTQEFDPNTRRQQQDQIQQELTGDYTQQVTGPQVTAQGVQVGSTIDGGGAEYLTTKAKEQAKATASLRELAALMGRIGSAGELRRKEAVGIGDTAGDIGRIQSGADVMGGIDQIGIQAAGVPNPWMGLASAALGAYGAGAMAGGGAGAAGGGATSYANPGLRQMANVPRGWL